MTNMQNQPSYALTLEAIATRLPFAVEDLPAANRAYARWHQYGKIEDKRIVDIWTYCFVAGYFHYHLHHPETESLADLDLLIAEVLRRIIEHGPELRRADRYGAWVSVICRNGLRNYRARRRRTVRGVPDHPDDVFTAEPEQTYRSHRTVEAVQAAIERLPDFLRETARLRLLEERSYREISTATGRPVPTVRAYTNRLLNRLRADPHLIQLARGD